MKLSDHDRVVEEPPDAEGLVDRDLRAIALISGVWRSASVKGQCGSLMSRTHRATEPNHMTALSGAAA